MNHQCISLKFQSGVVLFISLIMLLLLTLIGVTSVQTTILEEKMAGNMRNRNLAFQAAEAALRHAEQYVIDGSADSKATVMNVIQGPFNIPIASALAGLSSQPQYTIELIAVDYYPTNPAKFATFRLTSTAVGGNSTARVQLQSVYIAQIADPLTAI